MFLCQLPKSSAAHELKTRPGRRTDTPCSIYPISLACSRRTKPCTQALSSEDSTRSGIVQDSAHQDENADKGLHRWLALQPELRLLFKTSGYILARYRFWLYRATWSFTIPEYPGTNVQGHRKRCRWSWRSRSSGVAYSNRVIQGTDDRLSIARMIFNRPLRQPWYGYAIAKYLVTEYKLNLYPHKDLIIYEMGAGNGTLMLNILDYIKKNEPSVYKRTRYNIIEISGKLAERQSERQEVRHVIDQHTCIEIINKSIFEWDIPVPDDCFFLGMEVIVSIIRTHRGVFKLLRILTG